jgi:hypothetical protein
MEKLESFSEDKETCGEDISSFTFNAANSKPVLSSFARKDEINHLVKFSGRERESVQLP